MMAESDYVRVPRSAIEGIMSSIGPHLAPLPFDPDIMLYDFEQACRIDYRLQSSTIKERMRYIKRLLPFLDKHPLDATREELRMFIDQNYTMNTAKALRVFYGRFLSSDLAACFKIPQSRPRAIRVPTREQMRHTFDALEIQELRTAFLLLATSGMRRHELLELLPSQLDMESGLIFPGLASNATKRQWITCFNDEAKTALQELLHARSPKPDERIFTTPEDILTKKFREASQPDFKITPQVLRDWFCCELGRLGVQDRYVDAFCGRIPKSVLGRHYTDYSPERLKEIYDKAGLKMFEKGR